MSVRSSTSAGAERTTKATTAGNPLGGGHPPVRAGRDSTVPQPGAIRTRASAPVTPAQDGCAGSSALIIQGVPNRSMHMPNMGDHEVGADRHA